ncbi:hypothetical protein Hanom_Chr00s000492g01645951 [Helianthus anomalus]
MIVCQLMLDVRNWWIIMALWIGITVCSMRNDPGRDEETLTHHMKSFLISPHWADAKTRQIMQGIIGWDWAGLWLRFTHGRDGYWLGLDYFTGFVWDGNHKGWAGDIRGWLGSNPHSFSGVCLVASSFNSLVWSLGVLLINNFLSLTRSIICWRHLRWFRIDLMPGIGINMGDIRKDWLGGSSFRCSPVWIPTPMLGTRLGYRNLIIIFSNMFVGLGWTVGWARYIVSHLRWFICLHSFPEGILDILGWVKFIALMLQDRDFRSTYMDGAKSWLHQIGPSWRMHYMYFSSIWPRGNFVIKGWDMLPTLHCKLVWNYQLWDFAQLLRKYGWSRRMQWYHYNFGKKWACNWDRVVRTGITVLWNQYNLCYKCWWSEFQPTDINVCRGNMVNYGVGHTNTPTGVHFKCCQLSSCSCNRVKVKIVDNLAVVPQGHIRLFRMDNDLPEGAVGRLELFSFCSGCLNLVDMQDISLVYYRGRSVISISYRLSRVCCANRGLDSGADLCLDSNEKGWVIHIFLLLRARATHVGYVWGVVVYWLHQTWKHDCLSKSGVLWRITRPRSRGNIVIFGWVNLVQRIATACAPEKSWNWVGYMRRPLMHLLSLGTKYHLTWIRCCYYLLGPSLLFGFATQAQGVMCLRPIFPHVSFNMLEMIALFWMYWALHGPFRDFAATIIIWAYVLIGEAHGHHRLMSIINFCGPPLMCGMPRVYSRCSVRFVTHCKDRVLCIPRVGLLVSYFWSPEHVSGDEEGGMPPLKV